MACPVPYNVANVPFKHTARTTCHVTEVPKHMHGSKLEQSSNPVSPKEMSMCFLTCTCTDHSLAEGPADALQESMLSCQSNFCCTLEETDNEIISCYRVSAEHCLVSWQRNHGDRVQVWKDPLIIT